MNTVVFSTQKPTAEKFGDLVSLESGIRAGRPGSDPRQGRERDFYLRYSVQTGSGVYPATYPVDNEERRCYFLGGKAAET
jgi:hypothetical protein